MNCAAAIAAVRFTIRNPRVLILFISPSVSGCKLSAGAAPSGSALVCLLTGKANVLLFGKKFENLAGFLQKLAFLRFPLKRSGER